MDIEKTIKNLKGRRFLVQHFATGAEAVEYISGSTKGKTVGIGGCMTAKELGLYEELSKENEVYWHWIVPGAETYKKANEAEVYICSANAISEDGEIVNIDGRGNRLAGSVFGDKKLYIVAGINKIEKDLHSAIYRARNTAAPINIKRFPYNTPCKLDGKCHDCRSADRACNAMLIMMGPSMGMEVEVILIDENYGM